MKIRVSKISFLLLFFCLSLVGCGGINRADNSSLLSVNTAEENQVSEVKKVVALTSLTADIIYQLDSSKLVAIAGSSLLRQDPRFENLPKVSEGQSPPDLEKIVALQPDLVIGAEGFSDQTLARLQELGIKTLATRIDSWDSLKEVTVSLAQAIASDPSALLEKYDNLLPKNLTANPSTLVLVSRQPILAPNKNSWAGDLLNQFEVKNLVADLQGSSQFGGYVTLSPEKILTANPEIIIIVDPANEGVIEEFKRESFWSKLQATQNNQIHLVDYYGLVNPGSIAKIEEISQKLATIFNP
jgi:iron complex transport system substrate-binding protein